jgi:hypothetical protein
MGKKRDVIDTARARREDAMQSLANGSPPVATAKALLGIFDLLIEQADNYGENASLGHP